MTSRDLILPMKAHLHCSHMEHEDSSPSIVGIRFSPQQGFPVTQ